MWEERGGKTGSTQNITRINSKQKERQFFKSQKHTEMIKRAAYVCQRNNLGIRRAGPRRGQSLHIDRSTQSSLCPVHAQTGKV